jgi:hypothetical protein
VGKFGFSFLGSGLPHGFLESKPFLPSQAPDFLSALYSFPGTLDGPLGVRYGVFEI